MHIWASPDSASWRHTLWFCSLLLAGTVGLSLPFWLAGWDAALAQAVYQPNSAYAWWMRQNSNTPGAALTVFALVFMLLPRWRRRYPHLRRLAVVWLLTAVLWGGLVNQVLVNESIERPRPRQVLSHTPAPDAIAHDSTLPTTLPTTLATTRHATATLSGRSFPSGHATLGFIFAVPFFLLASPWRWVCLFIGLAAGFWIGHARMVVGAHYFTDVLFAGVIVLIGGAISAALYHSRRDIPTWFSIGVLLTAALGVVLGNSFTLTLTAPAEPFQHIAIACLENTATQDSSSTDFTTARTLTIQGYGAPLSNLMLYVEADTLKLQRWRGVYHSLSCTLSP